MYVRDADFTTAVFRGSLPVFIRSRNLSGERSLQQDPVRDARWRRRTRWRAFRAFVYGLLLGIAAVIGTLALMIAKWG